MRFQAISWRTHRYLGRRHDDLFLIAALWGASAILLGSGLAHRLEALHSSLNAPGITVSPQNVGSVPTVEPHTGELYLVPNSNSLFS